MRTLEELFHIFGVGARRVVLNAAVVDFDGADGAEGAFIAENKVDCLVFDKMIGLVAILIANFVVE